MELEDKKLIYHANLILISIFFALLLGSLTDIISSWLFINPLPQISPLFILFPVLAMYFSTKNSRLIEKRPISKDEVILSVENRKKILNSIRNAFFTGAIFALVSQYLITARDPSQTIQIGILRCTSLFLLGLGVHFSQKAKTESKKELYTSIILILSIPIISLQFLEYSSISIWVFPLIIIISSLVLNRSYLLVSTTIVSIITQRLLWLLRSNNPVSVDSDDYIIRIGIFILAYLIGSQVHNIYVSKLKENSYQLTFQKMNADLSLEFININQENLDDKINNMLYKIGDFFDVDRAYLFLINHENNTMTFSNEWCNTGIEKGHSTREDIACEKYPWWIDKLEKEEFIYIENINNLPEEAKIERLSFQDKNIKSLVAVPVAGNVRMQGFLVLDSVNSFRAWSNENIKSVNIFSDLIANALLKLRAERKIEFMAYYDTLTKLPNRSLFSDRVNQAIHLAKRNKKFISVVFIDLDDFKTVNDTMGHQGGDRLLVQVAQELVKTLRKTDTVARFGGDEFIILLNNIEDYRDVEKIIINIMNIFTKPFTIKNQDFFITGSVGSATFPVDGEDSETLIKNADTAMYKAEANGKNQYILCTQKIKDEVKYNMILSNNLYRALERNELVIYYQPQIDIRTGMISGVEALLRWFHPERGLIPPGVFIPLAEKNGLINSIGEWVIKSACLQNKQWQDMGFPPVQMGVNLSALQFINPRLADNIEDIIYNTGLDPKYLELEVTESITIKETHHALDILNRLKNIGVSIAIDDFGTEYSSLNRLKLLPIDRIKIDIQFIRGIETNDKDRAITKTIINLANSLGLNVLAEGVETVQQLEFLDENQCDYIQGYYFHRPMPAEEIEKLFEDTAKSYI